MRRSFTGRYAIRFGVLAAFPVAGLVAGAEKSRTLDIPVMVWLLKGSNGRRVLVDAGYLYENLEARSPIAQTLDAASNLQAQARIRAMAAAGAAVVPGHDPAVFARYPRIGEGVVRIR